MLRRIVGVLLVGGMVGPSVLVHHVSAQEGPPIVVGSNADSAPCLEGDALYAPVGDVCSVLAAWEAEAVSTVRSMRGIAPSVSDYLVKLWAKADVRAHLLAKMLAAVQASDAARTAEQQTVVTWLQNVKKRYDIVVLERALSEFREYDRGYQWPGTIQTHPWCTYTPPEPYQDDRPNWTTCNNPTFNPFDLGPNYPDLENWITYGVAGVKGDRFETADAIGNAGMSAAAIAASAAVPTAAAIGTTWAALSATATFRDMIFPFLGRAIPAVVEIGWKGVTQAAATAVSRFAMFSSAAFIVGVIITVLVTSITLGLQLAERTDIPVALNQAIADAQAMPLLDLRAMVSTTNGMAALTELIGMYVTTADGSYITQPAPPQLEDELLLSVDDEPRRTVQVLDWSGDELTLELRSGLFVLDGLPTTTLMVRAGDGSNITVFRNRMTDGTWGFLSVPDASTAACLQTSPISCPVTRTVELQAADGSSFELGVTENSAPLLDATTTRVTTAPDGTVTYDLQANASWGRVDLDDQIQWWREDLRRHGTGLNVVPICRPVTGLDGTVITPAPADTFSFGNRCWTRIATSTGNARIEVANSLTRVLATVSNEFGSTASFTAELAGRPGTPVLVVDQTSLSGRQGDRVTVTGTITDASGQSEPRRLTFDLGDGFARSFDIRAAGGIDIFIGGWYEFTRVSDSVTSFEVTLDAVRRTGALTVTAGDGTETDTATIPYTFSNIAPTIRSLSVDGCATPCSLVPGREYTLRLVATDPGPEELVAWFEVDGGGRQSFATVQQTPTGFGLFGAMEPSQLTATTTFTVASSTLSTSILRAWVEDDQGPRNLYYIVSVPPNCCDVETLTVGRFGVPGAASNVAAALDNSNYLSVQFEPPANEPLPVSWFVECIADGAVPFRGTRTTTASSVLVGPLPVGRAYRCTVTGTNDVGTGAASQPSSPVFLPTDNPIPPTDVTVTPALSSVSVAFVPSPLTANPLPRTYPVTCTSSSGGATATATGSSSPVTVTGLTTGAAYACTVQMQNERGTSTASTPSSTFTMAGVPSAPTSVSAARVAGRTDRLTVSFTPGSSNALAPVTSSRVVCTTSTPGAVARSASGSTSSLTVTGLTPGATYVCRANSTNVIGTSAGSAPSSPVSLGVTPGVPTGVSAVVSRVDRLVVSFTPGATGTTPTTSYRTLCTSTDGGVVRSASGATSPLTVTALTVGRTYRCTVTATNAEGNSAASAPSADVVVLGTPGAVTDVVVTPTAGRLSVAFAPPANLGAAGSPPVVTYRAVCTATVGGHARSSQGTQSPLVITATNPGATYVCRVSATNAVGTGPLTTSEPVQAR